MGFRGTGIVHIGALLGRMCEEDGIERRLAEIDVCACWNDVVGAEIAAMTRDIGCRDGVFYVSCLSAVVRKELMMNREGLVSRLNSAAGKEIVHRIVIK